MLESCPAGLWLLAVLPEGCAVTPAKQFGPCAGFQKQSTRRQNFILSQCWMHTEDPAPSITILHKDCFAGTSLHAKSLLQRDDNIQNCHEVRGCRGSRESQIQNHFNLLLTWGHRCLFLGLATPRSSEQFMGILVVSVSDTGVKQIPFSSRCPIPAVRTV